MNQQSNNPLRGLVEGVRYTSDLALRVLPWIALSAWPAYFTYLAENAETIAAQNHYGFQAMRTMEAAGAFGVAVTVVCAGYALLPSGWRGLSVLVAAGIALAVVGGTTRPGEGSAPEAKMSSTPFLARSAGDFARPADPVDMPWDPHGENHGLDERSERIPSIDETVTVQPQEMEHAAKPNPDRRSYWKAYSGNTRVHHPAVKTALMRVSYNRGWQGDDTRCAPLSDGLTGTIARINDDMGPILDRFERDLSRLFMKARALPFEKLGAYRP